ncbi:unnamed protein product, partial [Symbiodinium microadriaticum]
MASSSSAVAGYVDGEAPVAEPVVSSAGETDGSDSEGETTEEEEPTTPNEQEKQDKDDRNDPDDDVPDILAECENMVPENPEDFFYDSEVITILESGEDARAMIKERYEWYAKMMVAMKKADKKLKTLNKKRESEAKKTKDKEEKAKETKSKNEALYNLNLRFNETVVVVQVTGKSTFKDIREAFASKAGVSKVNAKKMTFYRGDTCLNDHPRRQVAGELKLRDGDELVVRPTLSGGGLVRRPLKHEDALEQLKVKTLAKLKKSETQSDSISTTEEIETFIQSIKQSIAEIEVLQTKGIRLVKSALKTLNTEDLKTLQDIMQHKGFGRREESSEKIVKIFGVIYPKCFIVEDAIRKISAFQCEMAETFVAIYIKEYAVSKSGEAYINNKKFLSEVQNEIDNRLEPNATAEQS